jgi:N-acetylmuramic acid 6-phosphate etherase
VTAGSLPEPGRILPPHSPGAAERRNPRTVDIDRQSSLDLLRTLHAEDALVPAAVADGVFVAHHAGGPGSLLHPNEGAEDDAPAGAAEAALSVRRRDLAVGLSACGRTPYVLGALAAARRAGAATVLVTSDPTLDADVDVLVAADTGPEPVAGSTRMKAGTAQKLMLTAFSTAVMIRTGRTYSNLMVDLVAGNTKLRDRVVTILMEATGLDQPRSVAVLAEAGGELKTALVSVLGDVEIPVARRALAGSGGQVRRALDALG